MPYKSAKPGADNNEIVFRLLQSVGRQSAQTHRGLARELNIALGLTNTYVRRCVNRGLLKVKKTPARRYAYFLTPRGFAAKARLSAEFFSASFSVFRQARSEYTELLIEAGQRGFRRIVLAGMSDLAEITVICALGIDVQIVAVVDRASVAKSFVGFPVANSLDDLKTSYDAVIVTELQTPQKVYDYAISVAGEDRVLAPAMLGLSTRARAKQRIMNAEHT